MLNPKLRLNDRLFDEDVELAPTRKGYGDGLEKLGEKNPNVVVLTADLEESTQCQKFAQKFPERFIECGVAEQNMAAIAAGLGVAGKIPFISSYATFSPGKNWETIRTTIIYNQSNVKIAGHHTGIVTGPDGATHQATEDIAIVRAWPGIKIIVPCDWHEAFRATEVSVDIKGPVYLRFSRDKTSVITTENTPFDINRAQTYWVSKNPQVTIFGTGHLLYYALLAAKELTKEKIDVDVVNVATIKPIDEKTIVSLTEKSGAVVTVEDHQIIGGLGSTIAEVLSKNKPIPMEYIGLQDTFAESGSPSDLIKKYQLDDIAIIKAVKKVIKRKS